MSEVKCPLLWNHLCVHTKSHYSPCCQGNYENSNDYEDWRDTNMFELNQTHIHQKYRDQMLAGIWPDGCKICKIKEESGVISRRQVSIDKFPNIDYNSTDIKYIDIKFNNVCNLACRMCNPAQSSMLFDEFVGKKMPYHMRNPDGWNDEDFQEKDKELLVKQLITRGLEILKVTGGEPFASKEFMNIINWCVEKDYAKNLSLELTTNATKINKKLIKTLEQFKHVYFILSIDGTDSTYNYIRHKADWNKTSDNIIKLRDIKNCEIEISCVLQFYNIFNFVELANYAAKLNIKMTVDPYLYPHNSELSIKYLPKSLVKRAFDNAIENIDYKFYANPKGKDLLVYLNNVADKYNKDDRQKHIELLETTEIFDRSRKQHYREYLDQPLVEFLDNV